MILTICGIPTLLQKIPKNQSPKTHWSLSGPCFIRHVFRCLHSLFPLVAENIRSAACPAACGWDAHRGIQCQPVACRFWGLKKELGCMGLDGQNMGELWGLFMFCSWKKGQMAHIKRPEERLLQPVIHRSSCQSLYTGQSHSPPTPPLQ